MKARLRFLLFLAPFALPFGGGCIFLDAPEPEPTPTPVPTPFGDQFDPKAGQPQGSPLNKPGDAVLPDSFRIALALSGDTVILQSVKKRPDGTIVLGAPDTNNPVKLAGIVAPPSGQTGFQESIKTLQSWTAGQDLDVHLDPRYPTNIEGRRMVHIFFKGRPGGKLEGETLSLNRMMIRSGYAIVDLYSPTSFDTKEWLFDETYARLKRLGLWPTNVFAVLQQRPLTGVSRGTGARSTVRIETAPRPTSGRPGAPRAAATPGTPPGVPAPPVTIPTPAPG